MITIEQLQETLNYWNQFNQGLASICMTLTNNGTLKNERIVHVAQHMEATQDAMECVASILLEVVAQMNARLN